MANRRFVSFLIALEFVAVASVGAGPARSSGDPSIIVATNVPYLALSAISSSGGSLFLIAPIEAQLWLSGSLALIPSIAYIYYGGARGVGGAWSGGSTILLECGLAWRPWATGLRGWYLGLAPGAAYATDSARWCFVASADAGYQWCLGGGLVLGAGAGGRYVAASDGSLFLPDLKLRIGWALR